jgi:hypothetical protein
LQLAAAEANAMRNRRTVGLIAALIAAVVVLSGAPAFAQDPFAGLTSTLNSSARNWAAALMLVGALIAGGAIMFGSHESGRHTRNFLFGAVFLVMAGAGLAIYERVSSWVR